MILSLKHKRQVQYTTTCKRKRTNFQPADVRASSTRMHHYRPSSSAATTSTTPFLGTSKFCASGFASLVALLFLLTLPLALGLTRTGVHEESNNQTVKTCSGQSVLSSLRVSCVDDNLPRTSAKMRIRIIPTKSLGCWAVPRTPASPTIPMAKPAARPARPTERPAPS
jgi:hypothetical protein